MKKTGKTIMAVLLCLCLFIPATAAYAQPEEPVDVMFAEGADLPLTGEVEAPTPSQINDTIAKITDAISKFSVDTSEMSMLASILTRFGGGISLAGGAFAILTMIGILKDPTTAALAKILTEIGNIQDQLKEMDKKLDAIAKELIDLATEQEEKDRQINARLLLSYWRDFKTDYIEPLQKYVAEYDGKINGAIMDWWEADTRDGIRVLYTSVEDEVKLTFSRRAYDDGFPDLADNGELVLKEESFGVPAELIPATSGIPFDVNTYADTFKEMFESAFIAAADGQELDASEVFYEKWNALDAEQKAEKAKAYANDFLDTVVYHVSCDTMSTKENNLWVIDVMNAYVNFCDNIMEPDAGINALISVQYYTHGLEGEIKDEIINLCDSMVAMAGYYGIFALNLACQDSLQSIANREALQARWVNTVEGLDNKKSTSLTGRDNFCYVAGAAVTYRHLQMKSSVTLKHYGSAFADFSATGWKLTDDNSQPVSMPPILDDVGSGVLFHQFLCQKKDDKEEFNNYLYNNGVNSPWSNTGVRYTTRFTGVENFALSEGIEMFCQHVLGTYFKAFEYYRINKGNSSKVEDDCFRLHDKIVVNQMNPNNGQIEVNKTAGARAAYTEAHFYWKLDEMYYFDTGLETQRTYRTEKEEHWYGDKNVYVSQFDSSLPLELLTLESVSLEEYPEDSALLAFREEFTHPAEPVSPKPVFTMVDWNRIVVDNLNLYEEDSPALTEGILEKIDLEIARAKAEGKEVVLSESEKTQLMEQIKNELFALSGELAENPSLQYNDAFGIRDNPEATLALVNAVLPEGIEFFDSDPDLMMQNTNVKASYEPWVALHFEKQNGKYVPVINPGFDVRPILVVWGPSEESYQIFYISSEVMQELGLSMNVRLSAVSAKDAKELMVIHYDNAEDLRVLDSQKAEITGSGSERYVSVLVNSCSPFELQAESVQSPKTGENRTDALWLILPGTFLFAGILGMVLRRKRVKA